MSVLVVGVSHRSAPVWVLERLALDADGVTTKINAPGPALTAVEVEALLEAVDQQLATGPRWLVGAGSLPPGAGEDLFVRVAQVAARHGVPVALDTSGPPLAAALRLDVGPNPYLSEDRREGIAAYLEKRPPQWTGR